MGFDKKFHPTAGVYKYFFTYISLYHISRRSIYVEPGVTASRSYFTAKPVVRFGCGLRFSGLHFKSD